MKAHKRDKKIRSEMSCVQAMMRIANNTFGEVENPSIDLMRRMIRKEPVVIMRMPQADATLKIAAIQLDISLLMHDFSWGFDTEDVFPGSTVWRDHYYQFFISACHGPSGLSNNLRFKMWDLWEPFQELSTWPASSLYVHERYFLRNNSFEENLVMAADLLANNSGGKRRETAAYPDVTDGLHACLEAALA
jgi:hypothetical protein